MSEDANADERTYWNEAGGDVWLRFQGELDAMMAPVAEVLMDHAAPQPGERVLDIGCGAGVTTIAAAQRVRPDGSALGLDISGTLLARARERAAGAPDITFLEADAQTHPFEVPFDLVVSRFGVMFFGDPVAAFSNIRTAMAPGARVVFAAWAPVGGNPWFGRASAVAAEVLGPLPPPDPHAPGPFAFADADRVVGILQAAGLSRCDVAEARLSLSHPDGLDGTVAMATKIGPASRFIRTHEASADAIARVEDRLREAFAAYDEGGRMSIPATVYLFSAFNSPA